MAYHFSADGQDFVWLDAHGLTRVSGGKRQKTDVRPETGYTAFISGNTAGDTVLVSDGCCYPHQAFLYPFPALSPPTKIDHYGAEGRHILHPDGQRYLLGSRSSYRSRWGVVRRTLDDSASEMEQLADTEATLPSRGDHLLGAPSPNPPWSRALFNIYQDGTFLLMDRERHCVIGGAVPVSSEPAQARWKAAVTSNANQLLRLYPQADWSLIVAFDGEAALNRVLAVPAEGAPVVFTVPGIGVLQRAGDVLAVQRDERTVVRLSLRSALAGAPEETAYPLSGAPWVVGGRALTPQNAGAFHKELITDRLWDVGMGDVLLHRDALWFVPWHGEAFCNLLSGERLIRRLPGKEGQIGARRFVVARYARFRALGRMAGYHVMLQKLRFKKNNTFTYGGDNVSGQPGLRGRLVAAMVEDISDDDRLGDLHGWRWSSGGGVNSGPWKETSLGEAIGAARFAAAHGIAPRVALWVLKHYAEGRDRGSDRPPEELSLEAEQVLLWMALEGYRRPDVDIIAELPRWSSTPVTEEYIDAHLSEVRAACRHTGQTGAFRLVLGHYFSRQDESVYLDI